MSDKIREDAPLDAQVAVLTAAMRGGPEVASAVSAALEAAGEAFPAVLRAMAEKLGLGWVPKARTSLSADEMAAIVPGKGWDDGRIGYMMCRFDALVCPQRLWRAELTFEDDDDRATGRVTRYTKPRLDFEFNDKDGDALKTVGRVWIHPSVEEAVEIASQQPRELLVKYGNVIGTCEEAVRTRAAMPAKLESLVALLAASLGGWSKTADEVAKLVRDAVKFSVGYIK